MIRNLFLSLVLVLGVAGSAAAYHHPPYYHHGHIGGVPFGYGYWNFPGWPGAIIIDPIASGFSFYPYYYYQPRYATYAVIAYSVAEDRGGYAWGQPTLYGAIAAAKQFCGSFDCEPVVWVQGGCAALAVSKSDGRLGWGYSVSKYTARDYALRACRAGSVSPKDCEARAWVCTQ